EFTSVDDEIVSYLQQYAKTNGWILRKLSQKAGKAPRYYVGSKYKHNGLRSLLRENGLLKNKHIPDDYFSSSLCQRKELLAGLVDTDGHVSTGTIEISQSRKKLALQIRRLAHSLGYKASIR